VGATAGGSESADAGKEKAAAAAAAARPDVCRQISDAERPAAILSRCLANGDCVRDHLGASIPEKED
jgi:hypothetical protein